MFNATTLQRLILLRTCRGSKRHYELDIAMLPRSAPSLKALRILLRPYSSAPAVAEAADSWSNPAAVLHGIDDLRFEDFPVPAQVSDHSVRVQMRSVGICGSDVHFWKKVPEAGLPVFPAILSHVLLYAFSQGRIGHYVLKAPMVIGHDCSGCDACCLRDTLSYSWFPVDASA